MKIVFLVQLSHPEKVYKEEIMPDKIRLNMKYIEGQSLKEYFRVIVLTFWHIVKKGEQGKSFQVYR